MRSIMVALMLCLITACATTGDFGQINLSGVTVPSEMATLTLKYDNPAEVPIAEQQLEFIDIDGQTIHNRLTDRKALYAITPMHEIPVLSLLFPAGDHALRFKWQFILKNNRQVLYRTKQDGVARFKSLSGGKYEIRTKLKKWSESDIRWYWKLIDVETGTVLDSRDMLEP